MSTVELDEAEDELETLLGEVPLDQDCMIRGELDGYLAGMVCLPKPVPNEQWLPLIWGETPQPFEGDAEKSARMIQLILARKSEIAGQLLMGDARYEVVYDCDLDGSPLWAAWLDGFMAASGHQMEAFNSWIESDNEDLATAAVGLASMLPFSGGKKLAKKLAAEMHEIAPDILPYYAEVIYRCQRGLPRIVLT